MRKLALFLFIIGMLFAFVFSSFKDPILLHYYGVWYNETRTELGIPVLDSEFDEIGEGIWVNKNKIGHVLKILDIKGTDLQVERNDFVILAGEDTLTIETYFRYKERCLNVFVVGEGGRREHISCLELEKLLKVDDSILIRCSDCD